MESHVLLTKYFHLSSFWGHGGLDFPTLFEVRPGCYNLFWPKQKNPSKIDMCHFLNIFLLFILIPIQVKYSITLVSSVQYSNLTILYIAPYAS